MPAHTELAHERMRAHIALAVGALATFAVVAAVRWRRRDMPASGAALAGGMGGCALLVAAALLGGSLVYRGGAGVDPRILAPEIAEGHHHGDDGDHDHAAPGEAASRGAGSLDPAPSGAPPRQEPGVARQPALRPRRGPPPSAGAALTEFPGGPRRVVLKIGPDSTVPVSGTQSIERAANIMRVIASRNRVGVRLVDVALHTRLERPTAHRILRRLVTEGLVMQEERTHRYFLGPLAFELGLAAASRFDLREQCRPALARLAAASGDTVFLTLRSGFDTVCIDRVEGSFPIKALVLDVGTRRPLGVGASGLALLMPLRDEAVREILEANAQGLGRFGGLTVEAVLRMLERARRLRFALNDAHITPDALSVGLALPNRNGDPRVAISIGAIANRMSEPRQRELAELIRTEVESLAATVDEFTRP